MFCIGATLAAPSERTTDGQVARQDGQVGRSTLVKNQDQSLSLVTSAATGVVLMFDA